MLPNIGYTNYVLLLVAGKQNATFSPNFTQLRKVLLVQPCISHRHCCHSSTVQCHFHYVAYQLSPPRTIINSIMGLAKRLWTGLVNFVPAVAYHFCLNFCGQFSQPENDFLAQPWTPTNSRLKSPRTLNDGVTDFALAHPSSSCSNFSPGRER